MSDAELLFMDGESGFRYYIINTLTGQARPLTELAGPATLGMATRPFSGAIVSWPIHIQTGLGTRAFFGKRCKWFDRNSCSAKHPSNYSGSLGDLHPRTKPGCDYGFIDSVYSGTRRQYRFQLYDARSWSAVGNCISVLCFLVLAISGYGRQLEYQHGP